MKKRGPLSGRKKGKVWPTVRVLVAGRVEKCNALHAAYLIDAHAPVEAPDDMSKAEARAILDARAWRHDQVVRRLTADGLLIGVPGGGWGHVPPEPSLLDIFRRWFRW